MPSAYTSFLSLVLCAGGFVLFQRGDFTKVNKLVFSVFAFLYVFLYASHEVADYFTGSGVDQATIIQMKFGLRGAAFGAYKGLISLTVGTLFASMVVLAFFVLRGGRSKKDSSVSRCCIAYSFLFAALAVNPATINLYNLPTGTFLPSRASGTSVVAEFYKFYKKPQIEPITVEQKNIVFIYAESLEQAFFNEEVFPNLVPRLKEIEKNSISFTNMYMAGGTSGTVWAISASQCGLPLYLPNLAILNKGTEKFLSSAACLGDLLEDEGYHLSYYGGASLGFTGKGNFFRTHGFTDIFGKEELIPMLEEPEYLNFWGLYDDSLFDITYKKFMELSKTREKFGIFMLTVDTHSPGYPSKTCADIPYQTGENNHLNSVACSDYLISGFIRKIIDSPFASKTVIVLVSDHVNWNDTPSADLLEKARDGRKNIFMIIEPGEQKGVQVQTRGTAFDIGTTLLPFIGYAGQIGLGRDLLNKSENLKQERAYILSRIYAWKTEILKFWGQPRIRSSITIDIARKALFIDNKEYKIPIFIELNDDLESTLLFGFNGSCEQHLQKMDPDKRYLMVGECRYIRTSENRISDSGIPMADNGWCLITGQGKEFVFKTILTENVHLSVAELQNVLAMKGSAPSLHY